MDTTLVKLEEIIAGGHQHPLTFTWNKGESWCLLGANASGKTTIARVIAGELEPDAGTITSNVSKIGFVSFEKVFEIIDHEHDIDDTDFMDQIDPGTLVIDFLLEVCDDQDAIDQQLEAFNLSSHKTQGIKFLSTGEMRKLLLIKSLLLDPDILVLDEPFDGLDVASREEFTAMISDLTDSGLPVMIVVNRLSEVPASISHVAYMQNGRISLSGTADKILGSDALEKLHRFQISLPSTLPEPDPSLNIPAIAEGDSLVELNDIVVKYGDTYILNELSWELKAGEHWNVIGPNGAGKSTLLGLISGDHPQAYANDITLFGKKRGSGESIWDIKRHIGAVSSDFQREYRISASVAEVVCSGFFDSIGVYQKVSAAQKKIAREWLEILDLIDVAQKQFRRLSYGEQRMILIVRALIKRPHLLLLDEPCLGLDDVNRQLVLKLIDYIASTGETTIVYITHHSEDYIPAIKKTMQFVPNSSGGYRIETT